MKSGWQAGVQWHGCDQRLGVYLHALIAFNQCADLGRAASSVASERLSHCSSVR
jgi:hypothetical protein